MAADCVRDEVDEDRLWVLTTFEQPFGNFIQQTKILLAIDRETNELVTAAEIPVERPALAVGEGLAWISSSTDDQVLRFDPTSQIERRIRVGRQPEALIVANGFVWTANSRDGTVSRIDPETLDVDTIEVGGQPTDIAANEDGV